MVALCLRVAKTLKTTQDNEVINWGLKRAQAAVKVKLLFAEKKKKLPLFFGEDYYTPEKSRVNMPWTDGLI